MLASIFGAGIGIWAHYQPEASRAMMAELWRVPLWMAAAVLTLRLILAPYWIWREDQEALAAANGVVPEIAYISMEEGGRKLYAAASERLKETMRAFVPDTFGTVSEAATEYFRILAKDSGVKFYARRAPGLPMEAVSPDECEESAFDMVFGERAPKLHNISIKRRDLKKTLWYYNKS